MKNWLTIRLLLYVLAAMLALFGVRNAFVALFMQADHEIVYSHDVGRPYCAKEHCYYNAGLSLANTGREVQERVGLTFLGMPEGIGASSQVLNLDASAPRTSNPFIDRRWRDGALIIELRELTPGTLVVFRLQGYMPAPLVEQALESELSVEARGRVIEGDPRGIAFGRWFSHSGVRMSGPSLAIARDRLDDCHAGVYCG